MRWMWLCYRGDLEETKPAFTYNLLQFVDSYECFERGENDYLEFEWLQCIWHILNMQYSIWFIIGSINAIQRILLHLHCTFKFFVYFSLLSLTSVTITICFISKYYRILSYFHFKSNETKHIKYQMHEICI